MSPVESHASSPAIFAAAVAALGTAEFAAELLSALKRIVAIDHLSLIRFDDPSRPPIFESAIWRSSTHTAEVQRAYLGGLYRHDPSLTLAYGIEGVRVLRVRRDSIADSSYRDAIFVRAGIRERLTIAATDGARLVTLNLYRRDQSGAFAAGEIDTVESLAELLAALAVKHVRMVGALLRSRDRSDRVAALMARLAALDDRLTGRELDVLARVLLGMTSEGIALDLRISVNTVVTYRKRAYGRLGVSSQAELFARCLV
jgi:DNA-binding CsgD family transcriptional regulator